MLAYIVSYTSSSQIFILYFLQDVTTLLLNLHQSLQGEIHAFEAEVSTLNAAVSALRFSDEKVLQVLGVEGPTHYLATI